MRSYFKFAIRGVDWWWPILLYWAAIVAAEAGAFLTRSSPGDVTRAMVSLAITIPFSILLAVAEAALLIVIYRRAAPKLSIEGSAFDFDGTPGRYALIIFVGSLLSMVTLGIYVPWFARRVESYIAERTRFRESRLRFLGKPLTLLPLFLVVVVVIVAALVAIGFTAAGRGSQGDAPSGGGALVTTLVTFVLILLIVPILIYVIYQWAVHFRWNDLTLRWRTRFLPSIGFMIGQFVLAMITLGIYWPAACLRLYRYFARRSVLGREGTEVGRFGFDGRIGRGFWFLWGQALLSLLTAGIYLPWGLARAGRWILERTYLERGAQQSE